MTQHPTSYRPRRHTAAAGGLLILASVLLFPLPAHAHGIGGEAADRSIMGFLPLGIEHMLLGWDHLLFVAGVVLLAREWRRAAKLITIFVIGHSTTLIVATLAGWQVDPGAVDVVIALSVVFIGAVGLFIAKPHWKILGSIILGFGLIHGLGLSTRLQDVGLPEDGVLWRVIAFNVGIEIGQLTAILGMVAVASVVATLAGEGREPVLRRLGSGLLFIGGSVATSLVAFAAVDDTASDTTPAAVEGSDGCQVAERAEPLPAAGGHLAKSFYEPGEEAPLGDFGHSVGDGYIAVLYPADIADSQLSELRDYIAGSEGEGVLAGASPEEVTEVKAITAVDTLTCQKLDIDALHQFKTDWLESLS